MSRISFALAAAVISAALILGQPATAEQRPVVVELFTSQGCSSCPPADMILAQLQERDDVICIALHVDYWDYIGWKDAFGDPAHSERQRAYAREAGRRSVYTPEMIVNGQTDIVGAKPMALSKAIAEHKAQPVQVDLDIARAGDTLNIEARSLQDGLGPMSVHMLRLIPEQTTEITRGENSGKTFAYRNIAHDWAVLDTWDGTAPLLLSKQIKGAASVVVLIQSGQAGRIVAAAQID